MASICKRRRNELHLPLQIESIQYFPFGYQSRANNICLLIPVKMYFLQKFKKLT